jgi:hypothetical protein
MDAALARMMEEARADLNNFSRRATLSMVESHFAVRQCDMLIAQTWELILSLGPTVPPRDE